MREVIVSEAVVITDRLITRLMQLFPGKFNLVNIAFNGYALSWMSPKNMHESEYASIYTQIYWFMIGWNSRQ